MLSGRRPLPNAGSPTTARSWNSKKSRSPPNPRTRAMVSFRLNGEVVEVPNDGLHQSAASYIRQHTQASQHQHASPPLLRPLTLPAVHQPIHSSCCRPCFATSVQSVKVSCAEGGCGACAVELLSPGECVAGSATTNALFPPSPASPACHSHRVRRCGPLIAR